MAAISYITTRGDSQEGLAMGVALMPKIPLTVEDLTDIDRRLLEHVRANPHHREPIMRWAMRERNGMSIGRSLHMLRQEIIAANAVKGGAS